VEVKLLNYADDIVIIGPEKEDLQKCLEFSKTYEKASNAALSESKCELISTNEEITEINGIKQSTEKVRHLGFFFNKN
jgi:Reverse transcriptase (RNA-dependent DNA polymerase)